MRTELSAEVNRIAVPLVALQGRHDTNVDAQAAEQFVKQLATPSTRIVWFENSVHALTIEEPSLFKNIMVQEIPKR